ncbi:type I-F CRISPR-associated protein Csy1 [Psychrobacter urativorans]|uniref:type I-F CRISPR-associated protein Csy1 n=1 Tax=Psychrobacter urativorans TaxID=45610 RepID=UPI0019185005|nr:type I-F CRISPR-associated protein Csy1 [Psychrobacter urativorans]
MDISPELASGAVKAFLASQYDKKTETEQKQLAKALESNDLVLINTLNEKLAVAQDKYQLDNWMDAAANKMAKQISFGTHISKGIHSSSKGDNINFEPGTVLPSSIVGHQSISNHKIDASGNAAALPLFSFFDFDVNNDKKIMDYIIEDNGSFKHCLSKDKVLSEHYFQIFRELLVGEISEPCSSEYNKQVLWPIDETVDSYVCIVPLYPSALTNRVYETIQQIKYSEEVKLAKKNRFASTAEKTPYVTLSNIASVTIGGSNPQGVSRHMSKQGGRNYLLPSMPPIIERDYAYHLSKFASSIFSTGMEYNVREALDSIFKSVKNSRNIVDIRDARKRAIDEMLYRVFAAAENIRTTLPAGWSKEYDLDRCEKLWLDPKRADMKGEEDFKAEREGDDSWHGQIMHRFARWLNTLLQAEFKAIARDFGDAEHLEWEREIEDMKKRYERAGKGVFL